MGTTMGLPPDIQEKLRGDGGIGSAAVENQSSVRHRQHALSPNAPQTKDEEKEAKTPQAPASSEDLTECPSPVCKTKLQREWMFCAKCGANLLRIGAGNQLGITLKDEDLQDYLFRGFILRDVKVLGSHTMTFKSSQPKDLREIDDYMMNGSWGKDENGRDRKVSEFYMRQLNAMCLAAAALVKFNGENVGENFTDRVSWIDERGSAFVDILSQKAALFNQAVSEFLKDQEFILGS